MPTLKLLIKYPETLKEIVRSCLEKNKVDFEKLNKITQRFRQYYIFNYSEILGEQGFNVEITAPKLNAKKIIKSFYKYSKVFKECEINEITSEA